MHMKKTAVFGLLLLISLLANGVLLLRAFSQKTTTQTARISSNELPFLSPRIYSENQNDYLINFVNLRLEASDYIEKAEHPIGFYFEYLPSGNSVGINEKENFLLASLLKVPIVMEIYRKIEDGELNRKQKIPINPEDIDTTFGDLGENGVRELTLEQAIDKTLIESDNTAKNLLQKQLSEGDLEFVYNSLDIPLEVGADGPVVTAKNYSSVLRSLYLSSFLSKEHSHEILDTLTRTFFTDKLPAGVDENIPVAHKIGVYTTEDTGTEPVFSDCGIVYVPKRPYILCLMVKSDEKTARRYMVDLSKIVYNYVSSAKPQTDR